MRTSAQIDERVRSVLDGYTASWKAAQASFLKTFEGNPVYAIEWKSDNVVAAQAKHVVAVQVAERPGMELSEAIGWQIKSLGREIRLDGGWSTSSYANANFHVERAAKIAVLEQLEHFAAAYAQAV